MADLVHGVGHQAQSGSADGGGGFVLRGVATDRDVLPLDTEPRHPLPGSALQTNATMAGCPASMRGMVVLLGSARDRAEVAAPVVELVVVDVVPFEVVSRSEAEYISVHRDRTTLATAARALASAGVSVRVQVPGAPADQADIGRVDDGVADERAVPVVQRDHGRSIASQDGAQGRAGAGDRAVASGRGSVRLDDERLLTANAGYGGARALGIAAVERAVSATAAIRDVLSDPEPLAARLTDTGNRGPTGRSWARGSARLLVHQDRPPGVTPPAVDAARGHFAAPIVLDSLRVGAA